MSDPPSDISGHDARSAVSHLSRDVGAPSRPIIRHLRQLVGAIPNQFTRFDSIQNRSRGDSNRAVLVRTGYSIPIARFWLDRIFEFSFQFDKKLIN